MSEELKLKLLNTKRGLGLEVSYEKKSPEKADFLKTAVDAAKKIQTAAKKRPVSLLVDNSPESAALIDVFLRAEVKFKAITISFKGLENPVEKNWKKLLKSQGVELAPVEFNYKNKDHLLVLKQLQSQMNCLDMKSLFDIWASCQSEDFVVMPGGFCLPHFFKADELDWELPGIEAVAPFNFSKDFGGVSAFFASTYSMFLSQAQSELSSYLVDLYRRKGLWFSDFQDAKKLFLEFNGLNFAKKLPLLSGNEPYWREALRLQDRKELEFVSAIVKRFRYTLSMPFERRVAVGNIKVPAPKNKKFEEVTKKLAGQLISINYSGGIKEASKEASGFKSFALFPTLVTEHTYKGNLDKILKAVKALEFFKNPENWVSETDLLLRPQFADLNSFFTTQIQSYFMEYGAAVHDFEITQCWASRLKKNDLHHQHFHTNSLLSGIFYLTEGAGGETVFSKHLSTLGPVVPTNSRYTLWNSQTAEFRPQKGHLLLFPSTLLHHVSAHLGADDRYSIAFNVFPRGHIGEFSRATWLKL